MNHRLAVTLFASLLASASLNASATATAEEAAKLGGELTPVGATKAGNADSSVPAWTGPANFTDEKKKLTRAQLEDMRNRPQDFENFMTTPAGEPLFVITKANMGQYAAKLTV